MVEAADGYEYRDQHFRQTVDREPPLREWREGDERSAENRHGTGDGLLVATDAQKELISGEEQDDQSCRPVEGQSRGATQQQVPPVEWAEHFGGEPCRSVLDDEHVRRLITE